MHTETLFWYDKGTFQAVQLTVQSVLSLHYAYVIRQRFTCGTSLVTECKVLLSISSTFPLWTTSHFCIQRKLLVKQFIHKLHFCWYCLKQSNRKHVIIVFYSCMGSELPVLPIPTYRKCKQPPRIRRRQLPRQFCWPSSSRITETHTFLPKEGGLILVTWLVTCKHGDAHLQEKMKKD